MKRSATFSCVLAISLALVTSFALAQGGGPSTKPDPTLQTLMQENEKKLNEMEATLNTLDSAEVVLEENVKRLEKALLEYVDGMGKALAVTRDSGGKENVKKELKMIEGMTKAFEARLRRIDTLHTALADKVLNATITLDEAWLNKMIKEQKEGYYRSLYPEGRQNLKKTHPEIGE